MMDDREFVTRVEPALGSQIPALGSEQEQGSSTSAQVSPLL